MIALHRQEAKERANHFSGAPPPRGEGKAQKLKAIVLHRQEAKERAMVFIYSLIVIWLFSLRKQISVYYPYHKNK